MSTSRLSTSAEFAASLLRFTVEDICKGRPSFAKHEGYTGAGRRKLIEIKGFNRTLLSTLRQIRFARVGEHGGPDAAAQTDCRGKVVAVGNVNVADMYRHIAAARQPLTVAQD